ncbi:DUF1616 domain-containing protein [Haloarcula pelagica]|uniref:DUF1616 domain-containing protein n=1 Tax=Haloarcula pelagica TaxID=3033389 RepID=UPI0024C26689|nr:DUF1616 domain-containing protein [Halomicroarcula sp. YJ-61-S]
MIREYLDGDSLRRLLGGLADIGIVIGLVVVADFSLLYTGGVESPGRLAFEVAVVLFGPGYLAVAALFPAAGRPATTGAESDHAGGITLPERLGLSFVVGIALVLLLGFVLNLTRWGIARRPLLVGINALVVLAALLAVVRRAALPPSDRFTVAVRGRFAAIAGSAVRRDSVVTVLLNVLVVVSLLVAVGSVGYAIGVPSSGENYTEFYLLTEADDGTLVADDYPTTIQGGQSEQVVLRVRNREHRPQRYTVVVVEQRLRRDNGSVSVADQRELDRVRVSRLGHNETFTRPYDIAPTMTGDIRIAFLLYRADPPETGVGTDPYRRLQLGVNVTGQA